MTELFIESEFQHKEINRRKNANSQPDIAVFSEAIDSENKILHRKGQKIKLDGIVIVRTGTYRKNSKDWDTLNYYRDCPTNGIVGFYSAILRSKDADRITNRVDTDQTAL